SNHKHKYTQSLDQLSTGHNDQAIKHMLKFHPASLYRFASVQTSPSEAAIAYPKTSAPQEFVRYDPILPA
ncbi:hypothetical protein AB4Z22_31095, partial [Paenibacillus sp. TAF58]